MHLEKLPKSILWALTIPIALLMLSFSGFVFVSTYEMIMGGSGSYEIQIGPIIAKLNMTIDKSKKTITNAAENIKQDSVKLVSILEKSNLNHANKVELKLKTQQFSESLEKPISDLNEQVIELDRLKEELKSIEKESSG